MPRLDDAMKEQGCWHVLELMVLRQEIHFELERGNAPSKSMPSTDVRRRCESQACRLNVGLRSWQGIVIFI